MKPSKCEFACASVIYLGHIVSKDGVSPDAEKIRLVEEFPTPSNAKNIKQFLGLSGYYRRFVKDFSRTASPLTEILRKDVTFKWTPECQVAFDTLKKALINTPILAYPDFSKECNLYVDASGKAVGMILGQVQSNADRIIACGGRSFSKAERNYSTTEQEARRNQTVSTLPTWTKIHCPHRPPLPPMVNELKRT